MEYYELINSDYLECCKKSHICYKVKVELLDHYENTLGELTTSISNTSGSINISYSQGVRRNCNISVFNYNHKFDLDKHDSDFFINRKFKVYTGIQAYSDTYWFSQGIFIAQSCSSDNNVISISGVDKFGLFTDALNSNKLQTAHSIPCDQKIGNIIKDTICRDMGNGVPTDPILPNIDSSLYDIELPYDIEKTANEYLGDILIEIATALHADIYYDTQGRLVLQPNIVDEYTMQSLIYEFEENGQEFIEQSYSSDYGNVINIITVTGSNTDDIVCSYTAKNENPQSPLNINNIGAKHGEIEETAMGYSEKRCKDYAEYLLKKQLMLTVSKSISCTPLPHLDVNKVVRINNKKENEEQTDVVIQEITMPLNPENFSLSVVNIQYLPVHSYLLPISADNYDEWLLCSYSGISQLKKYVNRTGTTSIIAPNAVGDKIVSQIGGRCDNSTVLEDGTYAPTSRVYGMGGIKNLYIAEGITTIGEQSFSNSCNIGETSDIDSIHFPDSLKKIEQGAFRSSYLESDLVIPAGVSIEDAAMQYSYIKSVAIGNNCTIGKYIFEHCHNLKAVTFGDNCTFNNGFSYTCTQCRNLQEITFGDNCNIGSFYNPGTSNLRKVVFGMNCSIGNINLTYYNANLEEFITDETTTISGDCMFNAAYYLRSVGALNFVDLPNTTYNINFNQCYSLQSVEVTNTSILAGENSEAEYTLDFYQCYNLKSFIIPDGVKALKNYVFKDCISLSSITIPYSVTSIGNGAFENCKDLESITILNPTCGIYDSQYTISNTATIYGHASSTAQSYANKYNRTFVEITE